MIKKGYQKVMGKWLVLCWILLMGLGLVYMNWPVGYSVGVEFNLDRGESLKSVSDRLEEEGLVRSGGFKLYIWMDSIKDGGVSALGGLQVRGGGFNDVRDCGFIICGEGEGEGAGIDDS